MALASNERNNNNTIINFNTFDIQFYYIDIENA